VGRGLGGEAVAGLDARALLASVYARQGLFASARGQFREAEAAHRRTIALNDEAYRASGKASDGERRNARSYANLAAVLRHTGRLREAEDAIDRAVTAVEEASARDPKDIVLRSDLALDLSERGQLRRLLGRIGA